MTLHQVLEQTYSYSYRAMDIAQELLHWIPIEMVETTMQYVNACDICEEGYNWSPIDIIDHRCKACKITVATPTCYKCKNQAKNYLLKVCNNCVSNEGLILDNTFNRVL